MCTGGRAFVRYVITKFSRMDGLPNFVTHGAPLRALRYNPGIIIPTIMISSFSYRMFFLRFFPQNITLLPKIVTEAHANLKKKKTSWNTTLTHYAVMVKYTPLERSSQISFLVC